MADARPRDILSISSLCLSVQPLAGFATCHSLPGNSLLFFFDCMVGPAAYI